MATTTFAANDPAAVKLWSEILSVEAIKYSDIGPLVGDSENSVIHRKKDPSKKQGDRVTFALQRQLIGEGITSTDTAEGNGESMNPETDAVDIDELGQVVAPPSENSIDAQRIPFALRDTAKDRLRDWWKLRYSLIAFNHFCGFTPANSIGQNPRKFNGFNTITAPTAGRVFRPGGIANDQSLTSTNILTLLQIDQAVEIAKTGGSANLPALRPASTPDGDFYTLFMHSTQVTQLRSNTNLGQWVDIQKAAMMGDGSKKNPIFTGALGIYNNVILRESQQISRGVSSLAATTAVTNTRRAVLLGAQAGALAIAKGNSPNDYRWTEESLDHGRKLEIGAFQFMGFKKTVYNNVDFGAIVIPTWAQDAA